MNLGDSRRPTPRGNGGLSFRSDAHVVVWASAPGKRTHATSASGSIQSGVVGESMWAGDIFAVTGPCVRDRKTLRRQEALQLRLDVRQLLVGVPTRENLADALEERRRRLVVVVGEGTRRAADAVDVR